MLGIGIADYGGVECSNPDHSSNYIRFGRDYVTGTVKPGYAKSALPASAEKLWISSRAHTKRDAQLVTADQEGKGES